MKVIVKDKRKVFQTYFLGDGIKDITDKRAISTSDLQGQQTYQLHKKT